MRTWLYGDFLNFLGPRGLETSMILVYTPTLVRAVLEKRLLKMAEPRKASSYKDPNCKK